MKKLLLLIALALTLVLPAKADAHVLITDETNSKGAILHIYPDDDPIAGKTTKLFFDVQDTALSPDSTVKLTVSGYYGIDEVSAKFEGSLAALEYAFPTQGVYELTFLVTSGQQQSTFSLTWRVTRGLNSSALDKPRHAWAEIVLIASGVSFAMLLAVMLGRWKQIMRQSTF